MPLQNRVNPWGALEAVPARGAWMGNRGILHDDRQHVVAPWRHPHWVTCRLEYQGVHRRVFSPHHYSELFFLDEATAFAAGHRPCAFCRRERFDEFKAAWGAANHPEIPAGRLRVARIDAQLHAERARRGGGKVTFRERLDALPAGTVIALDDQAYLVWQGRLLTWSHTGYGAAARPPAADTEVTVLTPRSIVALFRRGFTPQVHASAARRA